MVLVAPGARAAPYPPLPIALDRDFLGNLSGPTLAPGDSGNLRFTVSDPLEGPISSVALTLEVYAFNAFPGNATSTLPVAGAPALTTASSSWDWVLGAFVAAGVILVGAGAYVYFRRGPGSRSGTR